VKLDDAIQYVKGVGPKRAELLARSGIATVEDLLYHLPFRYEDRRNIVSVRDARPALDVTLIGQVSGAREIPMRRRRGRPMLSATFSDDSGRIELIWFHQANYFKKKLETGSLWLVHGRVESGKRGGWQIVHPEIEALDDNGDDESAAAAAARIVPVYQKPGEMPVAAMRKIVGGAVESAAHLARSVVPPEVRKRVRLEPLEGALRAVHFPSNDVDATQLAAFATPAHRTLIFEELFALQVGMRLRKLARERQPGISMPPVPKRIEEFVRSLPFKPTGAQLRVIGEVAADMAAPVPMNRLVHGDVGSGKTLVAFAAALQAIAAGYQVAVMAPTELLAEQHFRNMAVWAESLGVRIALLTGSLRAAAARDVREKLAAGDMDLVVGTHALVQDTTEFAKLGLAVIDEQHRFGVMQRAALRGPRTDVLMLSATPIPRTLSLTLFGDLDVSFLDEMPPGRMPVRTTVLRPDLRSRLHERMAAQMRAGRQCYIVYPLVDESEASDLADATSMAEQLQAGPFREFRVGLLHGRMKADEKDAVMRRFKAGEIHCLVATTVIEVGIDVPNATIMVVEHAERFGLAQLHQLRGRVGRGGGESFCCLVATDERSPEAMERLRVLERTSDGFEVAEADLRIRGPGEYLGTRQAGIPGFRAANLVRDAELLELARSEADKWLAHDPRLALPESAELKGVIEERFGEKLALAEVG
jgi:ATP-dependent DNA helicase RecG